MIVYQPQGTEEHQWVQPVDKYWAVRDILEAEPGRPVGSLWKPLPVRFLTSDRGERLLHSDLPWYGSDVMAVTRRARDVLEPVVAGDAEFLPLDCAEEELWLVHAWRKVHAVDMERAVVNLYSSGRIMSVARYAFLEPVIRGLSCFMDPRVGSAPMFVTDDVVNAVEQAGLEGGHGYFRKLWQSTDSTIEK